MGYWIKYFTDGTKYIGDDSDPQRSWRHSRSDSVRCVELRDKEFFLQINGLGEYWQSDLMEVVFPSSRSLVIARSIQRLITPNDLFVCRNTSEKYCTATVLDGSIPNPGCAVPIIPKQVGKWLTLTCCLKSGLVIYTFKDSKL